MNEIFKTVQHRKPNYNTFDLSHDKKLSMNMGLLVPTFVMDIIPGDKVTVNSAQLIRMAPMLAPVMHQVTAYTHYFFVPNRLTWDNFPDFITGGEDGEDNSVWPYIEYDQEDGTPSSLYDYMGLPPNPSQFATYVSALPFAAYNLIYNEYYRDQNLQPVKKQYKLTNGANLAIKADIRVHRRAWQHDYFTSALPWTQKGPEATIPLGTYAPVEWWDVADGNPLYGVGKFRDTDDGSLIGAGAVSSGASGQLLVAGHGSQAINLDNSDNLRVDLSGATAASINDLRRAFRLQEWLEKAARGGTRYSEAIYSFFGVKSSDARLQRPEYLGGGASPIQFSEVLQSSGTPEDLATGYTKTPQGTMAGHGINAGENGGFRYYAEEHGYIIGIMSVMPKTTYQQGIPKHFLRVDKFDYYWMQFAHLGEQEIKNKELYLDPSDGKDPLPFGYTPRYAEYKHIGSSVHGDMRTTLDFWHLGRYFENRPLLNSQFIECDPGEQIFAVEDEGATDKLWCHIYNQVKAKRLMPVFGTPTI